MRVAVRVHLWILQGLTSVAQFLILTASWLTLVNGTVNRGADVLVVLARLTTISRVVAPTNMLRDCVIESKSSLVPRVQHARLVILVSMLRRCWRRRNRIDQLLEVWS